MPLGGFVEISIESAASQQAGLVVMANVKTCKRRNFEGFNGAVAAVDADTELCFGSIHLVAPVFWSTVHIGITGKIV